MSTNTISIRTALVAGFMAMTMAGNPGTAEAQDRWALERAAAMETEARSLEDQKERWGHAAWLYRQAATLRPAGDPEAVIDYQTAAKLAYYTGDAVQAREDLEAAAERAMEGGDAYTAASLLVDAAWVAQKAGQRWRAAILVKKARRVADAPVLSDAVRGEVLGRIEIESEAEGATVAANFPTDGGAGR